MDRIIQENLKTFAKGFMNQQSKLAELEEENRKLKDIICLYKSDEEEYKNKIEELEDEIRSLYNEASYLGFKF